MRSFKPKAKGKTEFTIAADAVPIRTVRIAADYFRKCDDCGKPQPLELRQPDKTRGYLADQPWCAECRKASAIKRRKDIKNRSDRQPEA